MPSPTSTFPATFKGLHCVTTVVFKFVEDFEIVILKLNVNSIRFRHSFNVSNFVSIRFLAQANQDAFLLDFSEYLSRQSLSSRCGQRGETGRVREKGVPLKVMRKTLRLLRITFTRNIW